MDLVTSTQSESPVRETRTPTVREYEETIEQLKKENFDLKLRRFLLEEALQKYMHNNNESQSVQVVVELGFDIDALKKELSSKEQLLQEALEQNEKYAADIAELKEQKQSTAEIPLQRAWLQLKDEKEHFENEAERLRDVLNEKDKVIQNANEQINDLSKKNSAMEAKAHKKSLAIQGIVYKYHKDMEMIPKELRPLVEEAVQAAKECKPEKMGAALGKLKASLSKIMLPIPIHELSSAQLQKENADPSKSKTSVTGLPKLPEASQSVNEFNQSTDSKTKFVHVRKRLFNQNRTFS